MFTFSCDQFIISKQELGESLVNFDVANNDLIIGDRAYRRYKGFEHVLKHGGHFITRFMNRAFTLYDMDDSKIVLLDLLKDLKIGEVFDKEIQIGVASKRKLSLRVCAIINSKNVARLAKKRAIKEQKRKQRNINK